MRRTKARSTKKINSFPPVERLVPGLVLIMSMMCAKAQGNFQPIVLGTGAGQTLATRSEILSPGADSSPVLIFDFGFSSEETPTPDTFLDSFTVTLSAAGSFAPVLATIDSSGVSWAPVSPGGTEFSERQILRSPITPPSSAPIFGKGSGYSVRVPLPTELNGSALTVTFDLFDNLDNRMSLGWYNNLQIISVPEPQLVFLLGFGLVSIAMSRRLLA